MTSARHTGPVADTHSTSPCPGPALRDPRPGGLGWIAERHGALYAAEYGRNTAFEGLVAGIVAAFAQDHDPRLERVRIAELDGRRAGCVMCVRDDAPATARLRLLLVQPGDRDHGLGEGLVAEVVAVAREAGYRELVPWTNDVLAAAGALCLRHGFTLVAEKPHRSYGADLVGQDWRPGPVPSSPSSARSAGAAAFGACARRAAPQVMRRSHLSCDAVRRGCVPGVGAQAGTSERALGLVDR